MEKDQYNDIFFTWVLKTDISNNKLENVMKLVKSANDQQFWHSARTSGEACKQMH